MDKRKLLDMANWADCQMRIADDQRTNFLTRLAQYRSNWNDFVKTGLQPAFKGANNVHVPMTFEKIRTMHARIYQAVLNIDPYFSIKPRKKVSEVQKIAR